jgi:menaquinone-9 beta-reductase
MKTLCDVLIVGAGPAGLAAAIVLRQKGLDVLVADALRPPIDKTCGEGLMPDACRDLAALGVDPCCGASFDGVAFIAGRHQATARFAHGSGRGIRRLQLHSLLIDRCRELRVRLLWGTRVHADENRALHIDTEPCVYRYAVGADGQSSRMRSLMGLAPGKIFSRRFGARCHYRVAPWSRMVEVHWCDEGQAYITPVGTEEICVATVSRDPGSRMEDVLKGLPALRARLAGSEELSRVRGALTTTRRLRRVTNGNLALIGDASGSADAVTGEGIGLSLRQALLLGDAIAAGDLTIYENGYPRIQRMPHLMSRVMLRMDAWPWLRERAMSVLSAQPQLFARLLAVHLGERSLGDFLLRDAPVLGIGLLA